MLDGRRFRGAKRIRNTSNKEKWKTIAMKRIYVVHGFAATKKSNWFPWLSNKLLSELGLILTVVHLPNSKKPKLNNWLEALLKEIPNPDNETYIIAHSLGCITLLKYIELLPENSKLGGVILVSAFDESLPLLPIINSFIESKPKYQLITSKIESIKVIASTNDLLVPIKLTKKVSKSLQTTLIEVKNAGHFTTQDGYKVFTKLYEILMSILNE